MKKKKNKRAADSKETAENKNKAAHKEKTRFHFFFLKKKGISWFSNGRTVNERQGAKQSKVEQSKAKQGKAKQSKAEQTVKKQQKQDETSPRARRGPGRR